MLLAPLALSTIVPGPRQGSGNEWDAFEVAVSSQPWSDCGLKIWGGQKLRSFLAFLASLIDCFGSACSGRLPLGGCRRPASLVPVRRNFDGELVKMRILG